MEITRQKLNFSPLLVFLFVACAHGVFIEPLQAVTLQRSMAESATRLPCRYRASVDEKVVQVTWYKELRDGTKDQIITAHFADGHTEFGRYAGRMKFESDNPTVHSALLIPNTEESDDGTYACHISTFPNGNFERRIKLTVWVLPIASLEPVVLVEGQSFRVAASCRAVGRPPPTLSWDTPVPGQTQNRINEGGSVSSYYSLHPLRSMNGKRLDCLVRHPGLEHPRRIPNQLVVRYPPDATISASTDDWFAGLDQATLTCVATGFPVPQNITWTWRGGALPDGIAVSGGRLTLGRSLRLEDSGLYQCAVSNDVGVAKADYFMTVTEKSQRKEVSAPESSTLIIIIAASAAAAVLVMAVVVLLLVRHHRRRNKKLERQLSVKMEEVNNLSRQASFRRLNSVGSDLRTQSEDYALHRSDSHMKNSQVSLERPIYRGSQSTLGGRWAPLGGFEAEGRPVVWHDESEIASVAVTDLDRRRANSYQKSSNMSLVLDSGLPSSLVPLKVQSNEAVGARDPLVVCEISAPAPEENWCPPVPQAPPTGGPEGEEQEDDDDDDGGGGSESYQLSQALTNHFYYSNGVLRPRPHANAILLHPPSQVL